MIVISIITGYLVIMNLIGFAVMGIDKRRAVKRLWRIPESTLFIVALYFFHHKTRHWYFVYGMPFILLVQIAAVAALYYSPFHFEFF